MTNSNKLHRSSKETVVFGVAGGMAEYFQVDTTLARIAWVLFILATGGTALLAYVALAIILPKEGSNTSEPMEVIRENLQGLSREFQDSALKARRRNFLAIILIVVGMLILLSNLGLFRWWRWDVFWPLVLIGIGIALIFGWSRRKS